MAQDFKKKAEGAPGNTEKRRILGTVRRKQTKDGSTYRKFKIRGSIPLLLCISDLLFLFFVPRFPLAFLHSCLYGSSVCFIV